MSRKRLPGALLLLALPAAAFAHPSRGIVADPDGRVFFSDLERIWSIAPDGRLSVVREHRGVHTHELFLAPDGSLYGEDSYYEDGRYTSALWRRDARGRISFLFGPAANPPPGLGVVRDSRNCTFQYDQTRSRQLVLYRRCRGRGPQRLAGVPAPERELLSNYGGATMGPDGFYFRRGTIVYRLAANGRLSVAARGLTRDRWNFGIAVAPDRSVLAAEFQSRRVVRVEPNGRRSVAAISSAPWSPTGVAFAGRSLYILEAKQVGSAITMRVRHIADGRSRVLAVVP